LQTTIADAPIRETEKDARIAEPASIGFEPAVNIDLAALAAPGPLNGVTRSGRKGAIKALISSLWNRWLLLVEDNEDRSIWPDIEQCKCDDCTREPLAQPAKSGTPE
jgi:hypothetical protein